MRKLTLLLAAVGIAVAPLSAHAGDRWHKHRHNNTRVIIKEVPVYRHHYHRRNNNDGAVAAAAILGGTALLMGILNNQPRAPMGMAPATAYGNVGPCQQGMYAVIDSNGNLRGCVPPR